MSGPMWMALCLCISSAPASAQDGWLREPQLSAEPCHFTAMAFSHDGTYLAGGTNVGYVYVWDVASGEPVSEFRAGEGEVLSIAFSADDAVAFASVSTCRWPWPGPDSPPPLSAWRVSDGQAVAAWGERLDGPWALALSDDGGRLFVSDYSLRIFSVPDLQPLAQFDAGLNFPMGSRPAYCMAAIPGDRVVMGGSDGAIRVVSLADGTIESEVETRLPSDDPRQPNGSAEAMAVTGDGRTVYYGGKGSADVRRWEVGQTGTERCAGPGETAWAAANGLLLSADGDVLVAVGLVFPKEMPNDPDFDPAQVMFYEVETGSLFRQLSGYGVAAMHPVEPWVACAKDVSSVTIIDYNSGEVAKELKGAAPPTLVLLGAYEGGSRFRVEGPISREITVGECRWEVLRDIPVGEYTIHASHKGEPEGRSITVFVDAAGQFVSYCDLYTPDPPE